MKDTYVLYFLNMLQKFGTKCATLKIGLSTKPWLFLFRVKVKKIPKNGRSFKTFICLKATTSFCTGGGKLQRKASNNLMCRFNL